MLQCTAGTLLRRRSTIQLLRPHDIACIGEEFTVMASMCSDDVLTMLSCACDAFPFCRGTAGMSTPRQPFFVLVAFDGFFFWFSARCLSAGRT